MMSALAEDALDAVVDTPQHPPEAERKLPTNYSLRNKQWKNPEQDNRIHPSHQGSRTDVGAEAYRRQYHRWYHHQHRLT